MGAYGGVHPSGTYEHTGGHTNVWRHTNVGASGHPPSIKTMPVTKKEEKTLFKAKFLHLKSWKKY